MGAVRAGGITDRLARVSTRHPWLVVGVWGIVVVLGVISWQGIEQVLTTRAAFLSHPESSRGNFLIDSRLRGAPATTTVVCAGAGGSQQGVTTAINTVADCYQARWATLADDVSVPEAAITAGGRAMLGEVTILGTPQESAAQALDGLDVITPEFAGAADFTSFNENLEQTLREVAREDLIRADRIGLPVALVILILVIRALVAPLIPILLGLVAISAAIGATAVISGFMPLSFYVVNMIVMIGLAVGIDYALLVVARYQEERRAGLSVDGAIALAATSAGRAVLISGMTVMVALAGMLLIPISLFRGIAIGGLLVVGMGVLAALTLLPALLRLGGDRIDWPRFHRRDSPEPPRSGRGLWMRVASIVMRRPILAVVLVVGVLLPLSLQYVEMERGISTVHVAEASEAGTRPGSEVFGAEIAATLLSVVEIVVDAPRTVAVEQGIEDVIAEVGRDRDFAPVLILQWNEAEDLALLSALIVVEPNAPGATEPVSRLRQEYLPVAFAEVPVKVMVAGPAAVRADIVEVIETWQPRIVAVVLGMSFLFLLVAFRSVVVPLKATVMNLLSVGAATGLLVLVFQKGYGADLLGFERVDVIEAWVPISLFCVLFGLSMDYHVFLLSRIREHFEQTGDNTAAVAAGLQATGGIITGAAAIMVVVFGCFAMGRLVMLQQIGFGLAVAVLIDATVIRTILVPASMALLGRWNWYLPAWLSWLPELRIERRIDPGQQPAPAILPLSAGD